MRNQIDEIVQEIQKVEISRVAEQKQISIGDIVRWNYEKETDPQCGTLYIVVGLNSEKSDIVVTRILNRPNEIREFHVTQLQRV
jgi:hypothetical protein